MTYQDLKELLEGAGIPFAFHHWERPPKMPYGVYFDDHTENFIADNIVYAVIRNVIVELYTRQRDPALEERVEAVFASAGLPWDKDATYIDSERFWQVSYEMKV